jgi:uncharacterized protein YndB with AHSA1/START domain
MTDFLAMAATMQRLSVTGMDEASREGRREGDVEHVLLALVINEQAAGRALRSLGITLDAAREAVRAQHKEQLQQLGVAVEHEAPGRIVFHETDGYDWTDRALMIMSRSTEDGGRGDAASVLRRLLDEPSGLIERILARLGTTADAVRAALDEAETLTAAPSPAVRPSREWVRARFETFVPASIEDVWALVASAERMPEWEPMAGAVASETGSGQTWIVHAPPRHPDGKPLRVKEPFRRRRVTQTAVDRPRRVAWRFEYPDVSTAPARTLTVQLSPIEGGTQVALALEWRRPRGWRRVVGLPLRPLQRYLTWLGLSQSAGGISRVFRHDAGQAPVTASD